MSRGVGIYKTAINYGYGIPLYGGGLSDDDDDDDEEELGREALIRKAEASKEGHWMFSDDHAERVENAIRQATKHPEHGLSVFSHDGPALPPRPPKPPQPKEEKKPLRPLPPIPQKKPAKTPIDDADIAQQILNRRRKMHIDEDDDSDEWYGSGIRGYGRGGRTAHALRGGGRGGGRVYDPRMHEQASQDQDPLDGVSLTNLFGGRLKKGSKAAKRRMAFLRSLRRKKKSSTKGGGILTTVLPTYLRLTGNFFKDHATTRRNQLAELERLRKLRGGKFELRDIRDFFAGPIGWAMMGVRKRREKEIEDLQRQL